MKKHLRAIFSLGLAAVGLLCSACNIPGDGQESAGESVNLSERYPDAKLIELSGASASLDGVAVEEYDYCWHCDPFVAHDEVKNAPAEYYTGEKPASDAAVYIDRELFYFPTLPSDLFKKVNYDGETEWAFYYADGEHDDYIFATLPNLGGSLPAAMMHSEEEAAANKVLHITAPGRYILQGSWDGQIFVSLGDQEECFADENASVTLILNGVDIRCTVAPGVIFYSAYECDNGWEERSVHDGTVTTDGAGATVILADGSENFVSGTNVFRMLKTKYKDDPGVGVPAQKKLRKTDAAFYSYVTMNIECESQGGSLTVTSGFEGLGTELHLDLRGGVITINSQDDGINVNEDHVSTVIISGADVTINAGLGAEGDGIDSNGYIRLDGGRLSVNGVRVPDSALDSEDGITYFGGEIYVDGVLQSYTPGASFRESGQGGAGGPGGPGGPDRPGGQGDPGGPDGPGGPGDPSDSGGYNGLGGPGIPGQGGPDDYV